MDMDGRMDIATEDFLTLTQWMSPSYPIGAFAYSHGLETAIDTGAVTDADDLANWVRDVLEFGGGKSDATFVAASYRRPNATIEIDQMCRAFAASAERQKETDLQGAAFCDITQAVWDVEMSNLTYPVAVGKAAAVRKLPIDAVLAAYLHAFVANLVSVGMRLIPLGQKEGHKLIKTLHPLCIDVATNASEGTIETLTSASFLTDIASMKHETQYSRIYRT